MKMNSRWSILVALVVSILMAWLHMIFGRHGALLALLSGGAFILGWTAPRRFLLTACILSMGIPFLYLIWAGFHLESREPFTWLGDIILPAALVFPATTLGAMFGWFHNIVKDDF